MAMLSRETAYRLIARIPLEIIEGKREVFIGRVFDDVLERK
jgi:hypothetical protein